MINTFCLSGQGLLGVIINLRGQDYLQHHVHVQQYENVRIEIVLTVLRLWELKQLFMLWQTIDVANRLEAFSSLL